MLDNKIKSYLRSLVSTACEGVPKKDSFVIENGNFKMTLTGKAEQWVELSSFMGVPATADQRRTGDTLTYTWTSIADRMFRQGGTMSRLLPNYESREQQIYGSRLVQRAIEMKEVAAIEAGTGTGKSMMYLVPAIESKKVTVVATSNKLLQQQLIGKDLPFLQRLYPELSFTLAMGKNNFVCNLKVDGAPISEELRQWIDETQTGLIEDIDFDVSWQELKEIRIDDDCLKSKCPLFDECYYYRSKREREESQVIVTNHTLLALHTLYPEAMILPKFEVLIIDEAHSLPEYFRMAVGDDMTFNGISDILDKAGKFTTIADARDAFNDFRNEIEGIVRNSTEKFQIGLPSSQEIKSAKVLAEALLDLSIELNIVSGSKVTPEEIKCDQVSQSVERLSHRIRAFAGPTEGVMVRWINAGDKNKISFVAAPHDISYLTRQMMGYVFDERKEPIPVIFTSATLTAPDFEPFARDMGIYTDGYIEALTMKVDSPFDYSKNAMLYVPDAANPDPKDVAGWKRLVVDEMEGLVNASDGGALLLFSSNEMLNYAHESLYRTFQRNGFDVYKQGELPKGEIINRMRTKGNVVVFATQGFYEGVDVQGENLRLTVIDKLPFEAPSPLLSAQEDACKLRGDNPFNVIHLPRAIRKTKQAFGRLIRTKEDWGVVAILDVRVRTKPYGRHQVHPSLPPARYVQSRHVASDFLQERRLRGNREVATYSPEEQFSVQRGTEWEQFVKDIVI